MTCKLCHQKEGLGVDCERCELINRVQQLERANRRLVAEVNRRRGEMSAAKEFLDDLHVPKVIDRVTLAFTQRIHLLAEDSNKK